MPQPLKIFLFAMSLFLLPLSGKTSITGGYLARRQGYLAFLHLTQTGERVRGYFVQAFADSRTGFQTRKDDVKGEVTGANIILKVGEVFGISDRELSGTYKGQRLSLSFPTRDGEIVKLGFMRTSEELWNLALSTFKRKQIQAIRTAESNAATVRAARQREKRREELVRDFESAKKTVIEAQPAFLKWKQKFDRLSPETLPLEQALEATQKELEGKKETFEELREQGNEASRDQDRAKMILIQKRVSDLQDETDKLLEKIGKIAEQLGTHRLELSQAQQAVDVDWNLLNRVARRMLAVRQEIALMELRIPDLEVTPIGNRALVLRNTVSYEQPSGDKPDHLPLIAGTYVLITAEKDGFYSFLFQEKRVGWIRKRDARLSDLSLTSLRRVPQAQRKMKPNDQGIKSRK